MNKKEEKSVQNNQLEILQLQLSGIRKRLDVVDDAIKRITYSDRTLIERGIKNQELLSKEKESQANLVKNCNKWSNAIRNISANPDYQTEMLLLRYNKELKEYESKLESANNRIKELETKWIPPTQDERSLGSFCFERTFLFNLINTIQSEIELAEIINSNTEEGELIETSNGEVIDTSVAKVVEPTVVLTLAALRKQLTSKTKRLEAINARINSLTNGDYNIIEAEVANHRMLKEYETQRQKLNVVKNSLTNSFDSATKKLYDNGKVSANHDQIVSNRLRYEAEIKEIDSKLKSIHAIYLSHLENVNKELNNLVQERIGVQLEINKYEKELDARKEVEVNEKREKVDIITKMNFVESEIQRLTNGDSLIISSVNNLEEKLHDTIIKRRKSHKAFKSLKVKLTNLQSRDQSDEVKQLVRKMEKRVRKAESRLNSFKSDVELLQKNILESSQLRTLLRERYVLQTFFSPEIAQNLVQPTNENATAANDNSNKKRLIDDTTDYESQISCLRQELASVKQWLCLGIPFGHSEYHEIIKVRASLLHLIVALRKWKRREATAVEELNELYNDNIVDGSRDNTIRIETLKSNIKKFSNQVTSVMKAIDRLKTKPGGSTINMNNIEEGVPLRSMTQIENEISHLRNKQKLARKKAKLSESIKAVPEIFNTIISDPEVPIKQEVVDDSNSVKIDDLSDDGDADVSEDILNSSEWNDASMEYDFQIKEEYLRENVAADINDSDSDDNNDNYNFDDFNNDYASENILDDDSDED